MTDTQSLIARLEAATGPDRELDAAIWRLTDPQRYSIWECGQRALLNRDWDEPRRQITLQARAKIAAPAYTADVNAALKLVPPDCWQEIKGPRKYLNIPHPVPNVWSAYIAKWNHEGDVMGWGATPSLAIVIAAIRAKGDA